MHMYIFMKMDYLRMFCILWTVLIHIKSSLQFQDDTVKQSSHKLINDMNVGLVGPLRMCLNCYYSARIDYTTNKAMRRFIFILF